MDVNHLKESSPIQELIFTEDDLATEYDNLNMEEVNELIANSPPLVVSPPLKPNQTMGSEKISIRLPRHIIEYFRAEAVNTGLGYQTLINIHLNEVVRN